MIHAPTLPFNRERCHDRRYAKTLLTVIALALSAIAVGQFATPANAQSRACGNALNPCHVRAHTALPVHMQ